MLYLKHFYHCDVCMFILNQKHIMQRCLKVCKMWIPTRSIFHLCKLAIICKFKLLQSSKVTLVFYLLLWCLLSFQSNHCFTRGWPGFEHSAQQLTLCLCKLFCIPRWQPNKQACLVCSTGKMILSMHNRVPLCET